MGSPNEMLSPGDQLETLCQEARSELLLVAPFIKLDAFRRLLSSVREDVHVTCVTRWRPDEIAAGVSDIEIWKWIRERAAGKLWLRHDLHAKYYRGDQTCLVGSANVTSSALGWRFPSNYELLVVLPRDERLSDFEVNLFTSCVEVDQNIYDHISSVVQSLTVQQPELNVSSAAAPLPSGIEYAPDELERWIPSLRSPQVLFDVYQGHDDIVTAASRDAAFSDLAVLSVPSGLTNDLFREYVAVLLLQFPVINRIDQHLSTPRRFGEMKRFVRELLGDSLASADDASFAWQTLMRWLLFFLPNRYGLAVPNHSEVFFRLHP